LEGNEAVALMADSVLRALSKLGGLGVINDFKLNINLSLRAILAMEPTVIEWISEFQN
jgi:hypothetical protein